VRVNIYAEEMTDRIEIIEKEIDGQVFTGVRFYLYLPVTQIQKIDENRSVSANISGPFIHREGDDDSSAVTFWGKKDLRETLQRALNLLNDYHSDARSIRDDKK